MVTWTWAVITNLVKECCQFYLAIQGPQRNLSMSSLQMSREKELELLPWCPPGEKFTKEEYLSYIHSRNSFLRSEHGRAASLREGVSSSTYDVHLEGSSDPREDIWRSFSRCIPMGNLFTRGRRIGVSQWQSILWGWDCTIWIFKNIRKLTWFQPLLL